jgi:tRNA threonylcarbamoyl adenosine modification protein YeaZ
VWPPRTIYLQIENQKLKIVPLILAVETSGRLGSVALAKGPEILAERQFSGPMRHSAEVFPAVVGLLEQFGKKPNQIEHVYISVGPGSFTGLRIAVTIAKAMALANNAKIIAVDTLDCIAANVINLTAEHAENVGTHSAAQGPLRKKIIEKNLCGLCALSGEIQRLAVILDAKRSQFFIAVYEQSATCGEQSRTISAQRGLRHNQQSAIKKILPDCLMTSDEFLARFADKPIALIGEGLVFYKDKFVHKNVRILDEKHWNPTAANVHLLGWQKALLGQFTDPLSLTPNYLRRPDVKLRQV